MLSRDTKLVSRSLGLEPIHFTVLLLKNSAVIEEDLIVMKKISRTLGWRITGTIAFRYRDRGNLGKSAGRVCQAEETALRMPRGSKDLVMLRSPCSEPGWQGSSGGPVSVLVSPHQPL